MAKTIKFFQVDYGDTIRIMGEPTLRHVYETEINHTEYPDFEGWLWDMERCDLVREVH